MNFLADVKPHVFYGMPFEEYRALPGVNQSRLWTLIRWNPAKFLYEIEHPEKVAKPPMKLGEAAHCCILEPARFESAFARGGPVNPKTGKTFGRDTKAFSNWEEETGKKGLPDEEYDLCVGMREAVRNHPLAAAFLADGMAELVFQWTHPATGLLLKSRLDWWSPLAMQSMDLKTARCAAPVLFGYDAYKYGAHFQAAFYRMGPRAVWGQDVKPPMILAVENTPPHGILLFNSEGAGEPDALQIGEAQVEHALTILRKCVDADKWPGYTQDVVPLRLPGYAGAETISFAPPEGAEDEDDGLLGL